MPTTEKARVLVTDAQASERDRVRASLAMSSVEIIEAANMSEALDAMDHATLDLVITELDLPDASGFVLCRRIRERSDPRYVPVVVISDWSCESDRILAFECGADDFVPKPYFARELSSRIDAVLRRCGDRRATEVAEIATPVPPSTRRLRARRLRQVLFDGRPISLTPKECAVLGMLAHAEGRVLSREDLIGQIWGPAVPLASRSIDSHIKSLRRKLSEAAICVETVRGLGYRYVPHPQLELRYG